MISLPSMSSEDADAAAGAAAARQNALACQVKFFFVRWIFFACQVNFYCWRRDFFCFPGEFFLVRWIFVVVCLHFFSLSLFSNQKSTNLTECFCLPCEIFLASNIQMLNFVSVFPFSSHFQFRDQRKGASAPPLPGALPDSCQAIGLLTVQLIHHRVKGELSFSALGKPLSIRCHLYLGIAQIAITPPPALNRAPWGTFFQTRFYHFTIFFSIFNE